MHQARILIVDDDPDIRDVLNITLSAEGYEVIEACDGEEGLKLINEKPPSLIILDYMMPKMDGRALCRKIKEDILLAHLPVLMLTGKGEVTDKIGGIEAGADDYIVKPFEPQELLARIKMILRRSERDLEANPLTRLPGNIAIINELQNRIDSKKPFAVCYLDLNKFKAYNDKYGFEHGDNIIKETARIIITTVKEEGNKFDFIGHIGGDDFVLVTTPEISDKIVKTIIAEFDKKAPEFYNERDRDAGFIVAPDRKGKEKRIPLISISVGIVTNTSRKLTHVAQVSQIGAELKSYAKKNEGSSYVKD
ncbi:MAG: diguanylate cyclase response regulator, partial [Candidatus Omnitrophica bacterium CG11_big_fil_rev_8_21_14_0_20_42_13]